MTDGGRAMVPSSGEMAVREKEITFSEMAAREQLIATYDWTRGYAPGDFLAVLELPNDMRVTRTNTVSFERFVYFRGDMHIRLLLQSNPFQCGQIIASVAPLTSGQQTRDDTTLSDASIRSNLIMKAGSTVSKSIVVPFAHLQQYYHKGTTIPVASLAIQVMNKLEMGPNSTATAANLSVFVSFPNADFRVIDPGVGANISSEGGVASKVTNYNIDHVVNSSLDMHGQKDQMESKQKGSISGCDRPNIGLSYHPARLMKYPEIANGMNLDYANRLDIFPGGSGSLTTDQVGSNLNEMDLRYLTQKYTFMRTITLGSHRLPGDNMMSGYLTPCPATYSHKDTLFDKFSLMEYCSLPFSYWRGDLKFKFEFVVSAMHVARLAFVTHYGATADTATLYDAYGQYVHTFDVTADTCSFEVVVPYRAPTKWLRVPHASGELFNFTMGMWSLRVINSLVSMESVSPTVDINVYMAAGDNFELWYPDLGACDHHPLLTPDPAVMVLSGETQHQQKIRKIRHPAIEAEGESKDAELNEDPGLDTTSATPASSTVVNPSAGSTAPSRAQWYNLRNIMSRHYIWKTEPEITSNIINKLHHTSELIQGGYVGWYSRLFRVWKGDVRIKIFAKNNITVTYTGANVTSASIAGQIFPSTNILSTVSGTSPIAITDESVGILDLQLPCLTHFEFLLYPAAGERDASMAEAPSYTSGAFEIDTVAGETVDPHAKILVCPGDNYRAAMLYKLPSLTITSRYFTHNGSGATLIPEYIEFQYVATPASDTAQHFVIKDFWPRLTHASTTSCRVYTSTMNNTELANFGIVVPPDSTPDPVGNPLVVNLGYESSAVRYVHSHSVSYGTGTSSNQSQGKGDNLVLRAINLHGTGKTTDGHTEIFADTFVSDPAAATTFTAYTRHNLSAAQFWAHSTTVAPNPGYHFLPDGTTENFLKSPYASEMSHDPELTAGYAVAAVAWAGHGHPVYTVGAPDA